MLDEKQRQSIVKGNLALLAVWLLGFGIVLVARAVS